ncbi:hypothetical protein C8J57DRAFT_1222845 [Mycena rebaudengoi]|nr:hypothetical protein C8J57DRAFT_1222845 [Mycena rebaudengoi]
MLAQSDSCWPAGLFMSRKDFAKLEAQTEEHTECIRCADEQFRMKHGPALTHQQHMCWANKTDEKHEMSLANKYREALNKAKNYKDELEGLKLGEEEHKAARIRARFQGETMDTMVFHGWTCCPRQREINLSKVMAAVAAHGSQPAVVIPHCIWTPDQPPPSSAAQSGLLQAPTATLQDRGFCFLCDAGAYSHPTVFRAPLPKLPIAVVKANTPTSRSWCLLWQWKLGGKAAEKKRGKGTSSGKRKGKAVEVSESEDEEDAQSSGADSNDEPPAKGKKEGKVPTVPKRKQSAAEEDQDNEEAPTAKKSKKAAVSATKATKPAACATSTAAATAKPKKKAGGKTASSALPVGMHSISNAAHGDNDDSSNSSNTDAATYKPPKAAAAAALVLSSNSDSDSD